jgi:hypothetical protein
MTIKSLFGMERRRRHTSSLGSAAQAWRNAAVGLTVLAIMAWFYVPEVTLVRRLAAQGTIADGVVRSVKSYKSEPNPRKYGPTWYEIQVTGPQDSVRFKTTTKHQVGDQVRYITSPDDDAARELSHSVTRDGVVRDLLIDPYNVIGAVFIAIVLVHTGRETFRGIRAIAGSSAPSPTAEP